MKDRFSAPEIARRHHPALTKTLRNHLTKHPEETATKLINLAHEALAPQPQRINALRRSLSATVDLYQCLDRNAKELKNEASLILATTPYATFFYCMPGIFLCETTLMSESLTKQSRQTSSNSNLPNFL